MPAPALEIRYEPAIEQALGRIESLLQGRYPVSRRTLGLLLLENDLEIVDLVRAREPPSVFDAVMAQVGELRTTYRLSLHLAIRSPRAEKCEVILEEIFDDGSRSGSTLARRLSDFCLHPLAGFLLLAVSLYFGIYWFVGVFAAGTLVDLAENSLFASLVNPSVERLVRGLIPWWRWADLFVGEYGLWTLAVTYAVAIVLPVVGAFFLVFSVAEDSGYFPRVALMLDRLFKKLGLSGRAVIPLMLGLGCDTMGTITTRTLETRRERIIATLLLALAIPCAAQLGIVTAILARAGGTAVAIYAGTLLGVFVLVGYLAAKTLPGAPPSFYMELPPLRLPLPRNVLVKTWARMKWYFGEIAPLFVLASLVLWTLDVTGGLSFLLRWLSPVMGILGFDSSKQTAMAETFLFGFFRRDFGAAGLFMLGEKGELDPALDLSTAQWIVSAVTLTLFVPCLAQLLVMCKERGAKVALAMFGFVTAFALSVGALLNLILGAFLG
ncbi:MAG: nucleoside recognition domain-containing protein [Planctomycetota bacterium]